MHTCRKDTVDFNDSAYVPFWESIEKAVTTLGSFDEGVNQIHELSHRYNELLQKYESVPPEFPLVPNFITKLDVQATVVNRLQSIVRKAQRDFQFATIYLQVKTNQILVAGFTNLGQAIDQMSFQITDSIEGLGDSVKDLCSLIYEMGSRLNSTMNSINTRAGDIVDTSRYQHAQQMEMSFKEATRIKKALERLDNIQRGRKPLL